jgi:AbrB family looped-hinge helix DNA binding protein
MHPQVHSAQLGISFSRRSRSELVPVVTVSPKYQIVIPKEVRDKLRIRPGQKVEVFASRNRIEVVPIEPIQAFCGRFPDLPPLNREPERI